MSTETPTEFIPTNELERLLLAGRKDRTLRPRFYRTLLESDLFVLVVYDEIGIRIVSAKREDEDVIPVFSSLQRLEHFARETNAPEIKHEFNTGREVLTLLDGATIVLNPLSGAEKDFSPAEVRGVLDGSLMQRLKFIELDGEQMSTFSIPDPYPEELADDLKASFAFSKLVRRAYLVQVHQDERELPQIVVGVDAEEGYTADEAVEIAKESLGDDEFISFIQLGSDPLSAFMIEQTKPLYEREEEED
jgi:hypothetical protein